MAGCNSNSIVFSSLGRRNVMADFKGGTLSSDGGTILLREADRRLQLSERIDAVIPDRRNQDLIIHSQGSMPRAETSNDPISAADMICSGARRFLRTKLIENLLALLGHKDSHNTWIRFWGAGHSVLARRS